MALIEISSNISPNSSNITVIRDVFAYQPHPGALIGPGRNSFRTSHAFCMAFGAAEVV
jgi:hypothetical protein